MFPALDISSSGLSAQRARMTAISENIANISTTRNEKGEPVPYKPRHVIFKTDDNVGANGASGVRVAEVHIADLEPIWKDRPGHPDAATSGPHKGQVAYPNVNMMMEFTDAMEAARAYEANLGTMEITKDLARQTLRILV